MSKTFKLTTEYCSIVKFCGGVMGMDKFQQKKEGIKYFCLKLNTKLFMYFFKVIKCYLKLYTVKLVTVGVQF